MTEQELQRLLLERVSLYSTLLKEPLGDAKRSYWMLNGHHPKYPPKHNKLVSALKGTPKWMKRQQEHNKTLSQFLVEANKHEAQICRLMIVSDTDVMLKHTLIHNLSLLMPSKETQHEGTEGHLSSGRSIVIDIPHIGQVAVINPSILGIFRTILLCNRRKASPLSLLPKPLISKIFSYLSLDIYGLRSAEILFQGTRFLIELLPHRLNSKQWHHLQYPVCHGDPTFIFMCRVSPLAELGGEDINRFQQLCTCRWARHFTFVLLLVVESDAAASLSDEAKRELLSEWIPDRHDRNVYPYMLSLDDLTMIEKIWGALYEISIRSTLQLAD